ncbi:MAG: bifunctional non-ous end joining protein LigD, partial [Actinomycetota bacterium]|nr:bifunctional non-ous end joining protein LigD [Actinomycetota bacterium]
MRPMLATVGDPPDGVDWAVEFAWDGARVLVTTAADAVTVTGVDGADLSAAYPELAELAGRELLLDGEIVVLDAHGRPDADLLERRRGTEAPEQRLVETAPVTLYLTDLLAVDGEDLCERPWDERRARLDALDAGTWPHTAVPPAFTDTAPAQVLGVARGYGLTGIVAKRRTSRYEPGRRSREWVATTVPAAVDEAAPSEPDEDKLATYTRMRDFAATPEPTGGDPTGGAPIFVVQRHRARRLHYDFRLEIGGALASWAVPRGPTLDPAARHMAVRTEDHPMDYALFEGVIPKGQYGGGDVIVWDRGVWHPARTDDPAAAVAAGELHFDLEGEKLAGRFVLVRRRPREGERSGKEQWMLVHKHDEHARDGWDAEDH